MSDRLSPLEAIIWRVGQDPSLRMTVGNLLILDRAPSRSELIERLGAVSEDAPRLRERPADPSYIGRRGRWMVDPDFDPSFHVRQVTVPPPGSLRQILDLVGLIEPIPFEPDRSPWDATLIDGRADGKAALFLRAHHVLTDGIGGTVILNRLFDEQRQAARPSPSRTSLPPAAGGPPRKTEAGETASADGRRPLTVSIDLTRAVQPLASGVNATLGATLGAEPADLLVRGLQRGLDVANSVSRQVLISGGPLAEWPDLRSMTSRFEVISFSGARAAALALGGSRNTLLVAAAASGLGMYLQQMGEPTAELRLATPTSLRHSNEVGGNWFAPIRVEVPTAVGHAGPQFGVVGERLARARSEPALRVTSALALTIGRLPNRVLIPALRAQADTVDYAATTLPGARGPRHICGAAVEESYPFGPRLGCPLNVSAFGNRDRLDVGLVIDPIAINDPESFLECLNQAFAGFVSGAGGPGVAAARPPARPSATE
jgi:diacylglycerol O-acyltransferase / wax synthase